MEEKEKCDFSFCEEFMRVCSQEEVLENWYIGQLEDIVPWSESVDN